MINLRYNSAIGNTLSELAILITAREWTQDYEWYVHYPIALKAGIKKDIADAIADGRRPTGMSENETIIYDFSTELHRNKQVSDATYEAGFKKIRIQRRCRPDRDKWLLHFASHADELWQNIPCRMMVRN